MLTNMENQLKEQKALDKMDEVLAEIPRVRKDLGYIPLVTPTSQIVGTQSVINVLSGERYKTITKEAAGVLKGEYGATPAEVDKALQDRVLDGSQPTTCRPADNIDPELDILESEFDKVVKEKGIKVAKNKIDDLLTYALFPQVGTSFLENRGNPDYFEPAPTMDDCIDPDGISTEEGVYTVSFKGNSYSVEVSAGGDITSMTPASSKSTSAPSKATEVATEPAPVLSTSVESEDVPAPLSGNIWKVMVQPNQQVNDGDVLLILEAMKMETEIRASRSGLVTEILVKEGDAVTVGNPLMRIA
jgi:oxaloacetate decarboxylase alpha subunit